MKKARIMLMAIAVIAVVGGTLAFRAGTFNNIAWCITTIIGKCNASVINSTYTTVAADGEQLLYSTYQPQGMNDATCTTLDCAFISTFKWEP